MPARLLALLVVPLASAWRGGSDDGVSIEVHDDFSAEISVGGVVWLSTSHVTLVVDGKLRSSLDGTLRRAGPAVAGSGTDPVGAFCSVAVNWTLGDGAAAAAAPVWQTAYKQYGDNLTVGFEQRFLASVDGFSVSGDDGVATTAEWGCPGSGFPAFDLQNSSSSSSSSSSSRSSSKSSALADGTLGYASYSEIGRVRVGVFPAGYKSGAIEEDGVPLSLFDAAGRAAVLAPAERFFDTVADVVGKDGASASTGGARASAGDGAATAAYLRFGLIGTARAVPIGTTTSVLLRASEAGGGMAQAMLGLGDALLRRGGRKRGRAAADANAQVEKIGYSSVGHYFYGLALNHTGAGTLLAVNEAALAARPAPLRFGYFLIDSWWYKEGAVPLPNGSSAPGFGGTWRWDDVIARDGGEGLFPDGLADFSAKLGGAGQLVMHMGQWTGGASAAGAPPYAAMAPLNASWNWVVEDAASLPIGAGSGFWDWLFRGMSQQGLRVYKLDHTQTQMPAMNATMRALGATANWLRAMADAAARHGVDKQYGGHLSSAFLHSTTLPNALTARVSDDYIPGLKRPPNACKAGADARVVAARGNVLLARQTLYPWAMGVRPYKDAFMSGGAQRWNKTTCFVAGQKGPETTGYTKPEWWGLQERYPELQALASALTAGPVASCDGVGDFDAALLGRLVRADGVLLKPDHPAWVLDSWWAAAAFGAAPAGGSSTGDAPGEVSQTSVTISGLAWRLVLGVGLVRDQTFTAADVVDGAGRHLGAGEQPPAAAAWYRQSADPFGPMPPGGRLPVLVGGGGGGGAGRREAGAPLSLSLPASPSADDWGRYTLWHVAPRACGGSGWTLLGELEKLIPVSPQRIAAITTTCDGDGGSMAVALVGERHPATEPGEVVVLTFFSPRQELVSVSAVIGIDGEAMCLCASTLTHKCECQSPHPASHVDGISSEG